MTKFIEQPSIPFCLPTYSADFDRILGADLFMMLKGQILFRDKEGQPVLSNIDNKNNIYTEEEYQLLPENAPYQLIQGKLIYMLSPFDRHQKILGNLHFEFRLYLRENALGQVRFAPLDVKFDKENIFQPDLLFVSNERKDIIQNHIIGAPDLVVEIVSKGTKKVDEQQKKEIYGKYNVLEYWIINPEENYIQVFNNKNGQLKLTKKINKEGVISSKVLPTLSLDLKTILA